MKIIFTNSNSVKLRFTLDMYCELTDTYRPYLRKGWHSVEEDALKKVMAKYLKYDLSEIKSVII